MTKDRRGKAQWREFEQLVARIEADAGPLGMTVTSPDHILCRTTGRRREVDASIRTLVGTSEVLVTIECRRRSKRQDVTWIEQLAAKRLAISADRTIAVSSSGFSADAETVAYQHGISLRKLSEVSTAEINSLLRLDLVLFWHRACAIARVGIRTFRSLDWKMPDPNDVDLTLPPDTDPFAPIFRSTKTGATWSLNDLWYQVQEAADPFDVIAKAQPPVLRTACFPYPGTVTVEAPDGEKQLGEVLLTVALWIEPEQVSLDAAQKIEYASPDRPAIQRVEFTSRRSKAKDLRVSLQIPKNSIDMADLRIVGDWPKSEE
ncbi:MAG: restriction endonuclease [Beijerinckiaceae bacterium]